MGIVTNITYDTFPKQHERKDQEVLVCFHYDTTRTIVGKVVRDDIEAPFEMIILLEDGRYILSSECMWRPI